MKHYFILFLLSLTYFATYSAEDDWEQTVDYNISVTLQPEQRILNASIEILYTNHAKTHLDTIWLHLWPNAYSKYNTDLAKQLLLHNNVSMDVLDRSELGGIGKMNFTVDNQPIELVKDEKHPDLAYILLSSPILPGETIQINTPFKVKIPNSISRLGTDGRNFSITQWFPKVAVYDENGWHQMPYLDLGEYYSDFGKYQVNITVPSEYIVAATGVEESKTTTDSTITYRFEQDNVHDFAWFASPDFKIKSDVVTLPNGHEVAIKTYHVTDSDVWEGCNAMIKNSILHFSEWIGPYPYDHCTVVEGLLKSGNGMEYPMITVIQDESDASTLELVVAHEVAHNWWQGMLANNERRFPWIDEGFASYYEKRYNQEAPLQYNDPIAFISERKFANFFGIADLNMDRGEELVVRHEDRMNRQQAVGTSAKDFTYFNYGLQLYAKAPQMIQYLEAYLGKDKFDECIQSFFIKYQFKHISPEELQAHLENCSNKDLDFFFDDWIATDGVVDVQLKKVFTSDGEIQVQIEQKGDIAIPVPVTLTTKDGKKQTVWTDSESSTFVSFPETEFENIVVDPDNLALDIRPSNNSYKSKGFHKMERIHPQLFVGLEDSRKSQFYFSPMLAGNAHDKFMLGLSFYNSVFPVKALEWNITPLYAFGSKQVNGIFNINYTQNINKERKVQLTYGTHFKTFSYDNASIGGRYLNLKPSITAKILSKDRNKKITHQIQWVHHHVWKELNTQTAADAPIIKSYPSRWVEEVSYSIDKKDVKTPLNAAIKVQFNNEHARISAETGFKIRYGKIKSHFSGRFWMGGIIAKSGDNANSSNLGFTTYGYNLAGQSGSRDYLFENYYLGRSTSTGFLSRQIFMNEGQFKFANSTNLLRSNILASSLNLRADFPSKWIPIKLYADLGLIYTNQFTGSKIEPASMFVFQAGAMISLFDEAIEIYFPFISSSDIKDFYELQNISYKQRISFALNLDKMNPQKIIRGIEL